ncbi:aryl-alcohol dehydrogenase-like predicted oxidoreductase [Halarchaeum rubridurum]|uniref:Oxidoreductase n=1 Tax=Halarchaeum rubridurum TaxID=489911 RepID=A0A830FYR7_9EURY|nr:aldo/keto reductase [Halarchaeum rubridurum]MBP1954713.1 aryl-alcohol dehydrogenase-like predicted oxidoreductase [Halarchaeum rubridurum]GGM63283.1 oxidoreductase [Halarchaeum rubridurum]
MEYTTLGSTGMEVSQICLGCMSFGSGREWMIDREESEALIERAIELGVNFFDTANTYSNGESEEILGDALAEYDRDEQVVATKVFFPPEEDAHRNATGLSRKTIEQELENSLDRLGMDTVDLYQIHRWDPETPIEQTLRALDDAVRRGKVRYLGASSMWAHQFADALHTSDRLGLERFATMQNHYNALYREEEREMLPLCEREGIGVIPWSPLARGVAARPHEDLDATTRGETDAFLDEMPYLQSGGEEINERIEELADEKGVKMAQIGLAWLLHQDAVDAPIVGTTSIEHLEDAVEATELDLTDSELEYLEEPYEPLPVAGHE